MTAQELKSLWTKYKESGEVEARNALAEKYLPLVKIVCGRLAVSLPGHVDKDDLLQSGFFGLLDALERFDPKRQIKFETYAGVRIRGAMLDYLRAKDWLPVSLRQKIRRMEQTAQRLETELSRAPTERELSEALEISLVDLQTLSRQAKAATVMVLDEYLPNEAANATELFELKETLSAAIERLPEKERLTVTLYYYEELTLKEISRVMHLTEARISQLHSKALLHMREYLGTGS